MHQIINLNTSIYTDSPKNMAKRKAWDSPLRDYRSTPHKNNIVIEQLNQEVKSLKSQLELQKCEKIDLQDELSVQNDIISQLSMYCFF